VSRAAREWVLEEVELQSQQSSLNMERSLKYHSKEFSSGHNHMVAKPASNN
jgi:hypothetical protein